ncbi:hypothetical protein Bbelb_101690 [Branchiostoma belcheri]|nr:hypothetical protein Bbelb_101690 [Branchiostoma belcheri]
MFLSKQRLIGKIVTFSSRSCRRFIVDIALQTKQALFYLLEVPRARAEPGVIGAPFIRPYLSIIPGSVINHPRQGHGVSSDPDMAALLALRKGRPCCPCVFGHSRRKQTTCCRTSVWEKRRYSCMPEVTGSNPIAWSNCPICCGPHNNVVNKARLSVVVNLAVIHHVCAGVTPSPADQTVPTRGDVCGTPPGEQ